MRVLRTGLTILALLALGACSESKLLIHATKQIEGENKTSGIYKVGNPYQVDGVWYYPAEDYSYDETGIASWYGPGFHEKFTANGEVYDQNALTAAHKTLPMPSIVEVTNLENGRTLRLKVNDRGPFVHGRIIDVSRRASQLLGFNGQGTAKVRVRILAAESQQLAQSLKQGTVLARADTPIRSDVDVSRAAVGTSALPPPPGARVTGTQEIARPVNAPEREAVKAPPPLDGAVTQVPVVKATNVYVQVGAFTQYQNAYQVKAKLAKVPGMSVTSAMVNGREFFRVRSGPITSVDQADVVLNQIIKTGYPDARIIVD
jgi:rare lipoprotein A